jgi:hypothetical protein
MRRSGAIAAAVCVVALTCADAATARPVPTSIQLSVVQPSGPCELAITIRQAPKSAAALVEQLGGGGWTTSSRGRATRGNSTTAMTCEAAQAAPLRAVLLRHGRAIARSAVTSPTVSEESPPSPDPAEPEAPTPLPDTAAGPDPFFGVTPQADLSSADISRMAQGGIGTLRVFVRWSEIQPSRRQPPNFVALDLLMLSASVENVRVVPVLYGTPDWVARLDGVTDCGSECETYAPRGPAALAAWTDFVTLITSRYGPGGLLWSWVSPDFPARPIRAWQIWNEENSVSYNPAPDPESYAALLRSAATEIHDRDPGATVILGGMFGTPGAETDPAYTAWDFLHALYSIDGLRDSFDAVALHPYGAHEAKIESQANAVHAEMVAANDAESELWITELGAASSSGPTPLERGPEGQAALLQSAFSFFLQHREDWHIGSVVWYAWRDTSPPGSCAWCPAAGLFGESGFSPKPAWTALMSLTGGT